MNIQSKGIVLLAGGNTAQSTTSGRALRLRGYMVKEALSLAEARECLREYEPDIILLDVTQPDGDGFEFCAEIEGHTTAHILLLSASSLWEDVVRGLSSGGDDYITKPLHPEVLLARIDAAMRRRTKDRSAQTIMLGSLALDVVSCRAFIQGADMLLKPKEFALLLILAKNEGKTIPFKTLYEKAWSAPMNNDNRTLRKHLSAIRKQLEDKGSGFTIENDRGKGYRLTKKARNTKECE